MKRESHDGHRVYQGSSEVCAECRCKAVAANPPRAKPAPSLPMTKKLCAQMNAKMATEPAKAIYGKRKTIVEPVFGQIKNSGFRSCVIEVKLGGEFSLVCATHNFKKIAKAIFTGLIRPEFGNLATNEAI